MSRGNKYVWFGIILVSILCRMLIDTFDIDWTYTWVYLSFLTIIATYYGIYAQRGQSDEHFDFTMDFKGGIQGGGMFSFAYSVFVYIFYSWIHPHFLSVYVADRKAEVLAQLAKTNDSQDVSQAVIENMTAFADLIYVPSNLALLTLISLISLSIVYALILSLINKFIPKFIIR